MKIVAVFYEPDTKKNYYQVKKVVRRICKTATPIEFASLQNDYHSTTKYNKSLSYCWYLSNKDANDIAKIWKIAGYEWEK